MRLRFPPSGIFFTLFGYISNPCDFLAPLFCEYFKHLKTTCTRKSVILMQKSCWWQTERRDSFFSHFFFCCRRICLNIYLQRHWTNNKLFLFVENYGFRESKLSTTYFIMCYCYMQILTVSNACYLSASLFIYEYFRWLISYQYCSNLDLDLINYIKC